ncbi:MAG TPA: hypothetical protein VNO14_03695 [Blastocatellia bacterium]|nr:hypothetical protein [Blastocatellia bacterium]
MSSVIVVQEWDSDDFHRRVMEKEAEGYVAKQETYRITPEMDPETGIIKHLYRIEMWKPGLSDEG